MELKKVYDISPRGVADQLLYRPYRKEFDESYVMARDYCNDMVTLFRERNRIKTMGLTHYLVLHPFWGNQPTIAFSRELVRRLERLM